MKTIRICENKSGDIACNSSQILHIVRANYGGYAGTTTCGFSSRRNCTASTSFGKVRDSCQNQSSCRLTASNSEFDCDPCPRIYKYLEVQYSCLLKETTRSDTTTENHITTYSHGYGNSTATSTEGNITPGDVKSLEPGIIAGIVLCAMFVGLAFAVFLIQLRKNRDGKSNEESGAGGKEKAIYVMSDTYQGDASDAGATDATYYSTITDANQFTSENPYDFAEHEDNTGTMTDNIIYASF